MSTIGFFILINKIKTIMWHFNKSFTFQINQKHLMYFFSIWHSQLQVSSYLLLTIQNYFGKD